MLPIAELDIKQRIERDNPWWSDNAEPIPEAGYMRRAYFEPFKSLALDFNIKRAAILLGPRRVGKTVIIKQIIPDAIKDGMHPKSILYASLDTPVYFGISLEKFVKFMPLHNGARHLIVFDEIQYLKDWETHLKDLVDVYSNIKFVAAGSAAAALRLKSRESGAGRFSDFMLPPLTFYEFLNFIGEDDHLIKIGSEGEYLTQDINSLNARFIDYLNYGGYPEAVLNETIRRNPDQFIRNDVIDKVLLKRFTQPLWYKCYPGVEQIVLIPGLQCRGGSKFRKYRPGIRDHKAHDQALY